MGPDYGRRCRALLMADIFAREMTREKKEKTGET